jgi:tetraacyldisaccharide-1-P 4'-kinase
MKLSTERDARLITTEKDFVRLPQEMKSITHCASVEARFEDLPAFARLLDGALT